MSSFNDREKSHENNHARQEKLSFEVEARACKFFGLWAAQKMGLTGQEAADYAVSVVEANLEEAGLDDVLGKVSADFKAKAVQISDHVMEVELEKAIQQARTQIMGSAD